MYLYPKWIRAWHILNAILFLVLIVTGISMYYTDMEGASVLVGFARAVKLHNIAAFILTGNYVIFVLGNAFTTNGKYYRIKNENFWSDLSIQIKYYAYGMFKGEKHPFPVTMESKFDPLKKLLYVLAMYVGMPVLIISGIVLMFPGLAFTSIFGVSGLVLFDILHISSGFILSIFLLIHIYICTLGAKPTSLLWGMISGYYRPDDY